MKTHAIPSAYLTIELPALTPALWSALFHEERKLMTAPRAILPLNPPEEDTAEGVAKQFLSFDADTALELFCGNARCVIAAGLEIESNSKRPRRKIISTLRHLLTGREALDRPGMGPLSWFHRHTHAFVLRDAILAETNLRDNPRMKLVHTLQSYLPA